jgi:hypothetical protein
MWETSGKQVATSRFEPFEPDEVLYEFDGPRVFTLRDCEGELNLSCWSDEQDSTSRYVVVPTTGKIVHDLRQGDSSVYDALNQPRCWLCDVTHGGKIVRCERIEFDQIPADSLPAPGTLLMPDMRSSWLDVEGRIRELDKDRRSFELREISGLAQTQRFRFDEELQDDVFEAFRDDVRVRISGRATPAKNMAHAFAVSRVK